MCVQREMNGVHWDEKWNRVQQILNQRSLYITGWGELGSKVFRNHSSQLFNFLPELFDLLKPSLQASLQREVQIRGQNVTYITYMTSQTRMHAQHYTTLKLHAHLHYDIVDVGYILCPMIEKFYAHVQYLQVQIA